MSHDWNSLGALDLSLSARRASRPRARLSGQGHQPSLPSSIINPVEVTTPQHDGETYVADGSTASVKRSRHVGFTSDSGRMAATQLTDGSGHEATFPMGMSQPEDAVSDVRLTTCVTPGRLT